MRIEDQIDISKLDWEYIWQKDYQKDRKKGKDWNTVSKDFGKWLENDDYPDILISSMRISPNDTVLDLGAAEGTISLKLAEKAKSVTTVQKPAKETPKTTGTPKAEEKPIKETPKVETQTSEVIEDEYSYHDDLDLILGKRTQEESPVEDEIQSEVQEVEDNLSKGSDIFRDAIASIRNIRGNIGSNNNESSSESFEPPVAEEVNKSLGEDIEYDEFISITPIHEEEEEAQYPKDLAYNQPNKDVDDIYKEINNESYNKTVDEELDKSFEDVDDDTYKTDAKEYTAEDYKKIEDDMAEEKIREENTKKLSGTSFAYLATLNTLSEFAGPQPDPVLPIFFARYSDFTSRSLCSGVIMEQRGSMETRSATLYLLKYSNS